MFIKHRRSGKLTILATLVSRLLVLSSLTESGGGRMVKLLACGARGPRFDSRPHHLNFRDWYILPPSCNMTERLSMRRKSSKQSMATIHTGKSLDKKIYIVLIGFIKMPCVIKIEYSIYIFFKQLRQCYPSNNITRYYHTPFGMERYVDL